MNYAEANALKHHAGSQTGHNDFHLMLGITVALKMLEAEGGREGGRKRFRLLMQFILSSGDIQLASK